MFYFSKFLASLFLPPGLIIILIISSIILIVLNKKRKGLILSFVTAIIVYNLSIEPVKNALLSPLENEFPFPENIKHLQCEAIVVLGGGIIRGSPDSNGKAAPSRSTLKRLYMAYRVWKYNKKPIIVSGGTVYYHNGEVEADVMEKTLVDLGIPKKYIIKEGKSRNTFENVSNIKSILEEKDVRLVCLITSAYHMPRSVYVFYAFNINAYPVPTDYLMDKKPLGWYSFIPKADNFFYSFLALKEYLGIFYYTFRYGI